MQCVRCHDGTAVYFKIRSDELVAFTRLLHLNCAFLGHDSAIIAAAFILNLTISLIGVAEVMANWVKGLRLSATTLILGLILFYLLLCMFINVLSMMVATIPVTYPIAIALGND